MVMKKVDSGHGHTDIFQKCNFTFFFSFTITLLFLEHVLWKEEQANQVKDGRARDTYYCFSNSNKCL